MCSHQWGSRPFVPVLWQLDRPVCLLFPRPCALEAIEVAAPRWSGPLPTSLSSPRPRVACPCTLWAELLCAHLPQGLWGLQEVIQHPRTWSKAVILRKGPSPAHNLVGAFLRVLQ